MIRTLLRFKNWKSLLPTGDWGDALSAQSIKRGGEIFSVNWTKPAEQIKVFFTGEELWSSPDAQLAHFSTQFIFINNNIIIILSTFGQIHIR